MFTKKFTVFLTLLALVAMLLNACSGATSTPAPAATAKPEATAKPADEKGGGLICVIVPGVENPFFGTMQEIAAAKAEELGYQTLKLVHDDD
ncbi:MAG: D-ribose ABC transporter substrate-binding protein, partial [Anaerolineae bacterium]|nr:D-ribose ABC transporter substrate-binding protein [Anaerolineae bacterium]